MRRWQSDNDRRRLSEDILLIKRFHQLSPNDHLNTNRIVLRDILGKQIFRHSENICMNQPRDHLE